ncbi:N-formylglutamate amidohydrolase [Cohaesibacter celericrescens]|uniref:N-formylglutamate amidohydrolase n=2 Tax=Cohaesibacter celericrescens TaxID=2067669 RepID=A0A2N5XXL7_9HYPH|nr:N-formylglutamate amidohydrolase [Cohaesibacter celericrescens]
MSRLLQVGDPAPAKIINPEGTSPILLVCEHAGQGIPAALGDLGLTQDQRDAHIGWDIGAAAVTHLLSERLNATAILQHYSRLVIDCNRPPEAVDSVPEVSDGIKIPGNIALPNRRQRVEEIFEPFHAQVSGLLDSGRFSVAISVHSFTPVMQNVPRPWDIGFLYRKDADTPSRLAAYMQKTFPWMTIGHNQPYQVTGVSDWFVPVHGEARGLKHSLIEIRNDHISTEDGQAKWADILGDSLQHFLTEAST